MTFIKLCAVAVLFLNIATASNANATSDVQSMLNSLDYDAGRVDGVYGSKTRKALEQFYSAYNFSK